MASLQNEQIDLSYQGLIKTTDNAVITSTGLKVISDGLGNPSPLKLSQQEVHMIADGINGEIYIKAKNALLVTDATTTHGFQIDPTKTVWAGNVDFQYATVTGLPVVESGLTNGVGANSLISSSALTTTPASAPLSGQIAIGNGATAGNIIANAIAIGNNASAGGGTAVGNGAQCFTGGRSAAYGANARSLANESVAIGGDALVASTSAGGIAIGDSATVAAVSPNAVAIGNDVTASTANTVTIKKLQMLDYATLDYADDTAAATGGIPLGGVYHTSGALKIRVA